MTILGEHIGAALDDQLAALGMPIFCGEHEGGVPVR
eukprot:CAMPEP_0174719448 /NCGR_PEP_ID=MMETSP1094-20130205/31139_1 /TAXON_ID=156173 /ORGANISM="Chrysochromulina brevifilum, Strain UTEX LB 985" /LENGTH=35 /DNA_ID= /DNA_START= /DNA_END= /DNA_ORIENTATION=